MREVLYEESIEPENLNFKKTIFWVLKIVKIIDIVISVIFLYFALMTADLFSLILGLLFIASAFGFGYLQRRVYYCVDCILVSGSTRLIKVINYKIRKTILIFDYDKVETVGKADGEAFERLYLDKTVKKVFATPNKYAENLYYVLLKQDGEKYLVVMDCKDDYIKNLIAFTGSRVLER